MPIFFESDIKQIIENPWVSLAIVGNLVLVESLLSVDNAAVLATMVRDLPQNDKEKALKYGIIGAYVFRGLSMLFVSFLIKLWFLKPLGGLYLLYLVFSYFKGRSTSTQEDDLMDKNGNWLYRITVGQIGTFWATVALVEMMDMAFSIDNVFAAVAYTNNFLLIILGVFIGILAMRFVAQWFVRLMEQYAFLEDAAFVVIAILGLKLTLSVVEHIIPESGFAAWLSSESTDMYISIITVLVFFVPIATAKWFNVPKIK
jgi:YkoY family integral membrane protein